VGEGSYRCFPSSDFEELEMAGQDVHRFSRALDDEAGEG